MIKFIKKSKYQALINELESVKKENELLKKDPVSFEDLKQKRDLLLLLVQEVNQKIRMIKSIHGVTYDTKLHKKLIKN